MKSAHLALVKAIDEAESSGEIDRALRLLVQNLPRLPARPAYRLHVADLCVRTGRAADATRIAAHCVERGLRTGNLLLAIAGVRMLERVGADTRIDEARVCQFASDRTERRYAEPQPEASELDLVADKPRLPHDLLVSVAVELASAGPLPPSPAADLLGVPVMTDMPVAAQTLLLQRLRWIERAAGEPLLSSPGAVIAWHVLGATRLDGDAAAPPPGSFCILEDTSPIAVTRCAVLALTADDATLLLEIPGVLPAIDRARARSDARHDLHRLLRLDAAAPVQHASVVERWRLLPDDPPRGVGGEAAAVLVLRGRVRVAHVDGAGEQTLLAGSAARIGAEGLISAATGEPAEVALIGVAESPVDAKPATPTDATPMVPRLALPPLSRLLKPPEAPQGEG
jgi:hypothetical protein